MTDFNCCGPLIIGIQGTTLSVSERARLAHPRVSGVLLFSRNYESPPQLKALTQAIHDVKSPALTIYVDQEGGRVQRFETGFTPLPPLRHWGELYTCMPNKALEGAFWHGLTLAQELKLHGVDVSFAPVVDLFNPASKIIGTRAFDNNPDIVIKLAQKMIDGLHEGGMPAILKHFPGHGNLVGDTHTEQVTDEHQTLEALLTQDLLPFSRLAPTVEGVMVAHTQHTQIDPQNIASQSKRWVQAILKSQLGFTGKIFSDDLSMEASKTGDFQTVCQKTLDAGCDFLVCGQWWGEL